MIDLWLSDRQPITDQSPSEVQKAALHPAFAKTVRYLLVRLTKCFEDPTQQLKDIHIQTNALSTHCPHLSQAALYLKIIFESLFEKDKTTELYKMITGLERRLSSHVNNCQVEEEFKNTVMQTCSRFVKNEQEKGHSSYTEMSASERKKLDLLLAKFAAPATF